MKTVKDNHKRHEIKFVINNKERLFFLRNKNLSKIFPDRIVESIYYDTNDLHFFHLSEEGITPRTKVRVRRYDDKEFKSLEIKTTQNHHREKIVIKNFHNNDLNLHTNLKKFGINQIVSQKLRVKYLRSYYLLSGVGRITVDRNIEFLNPNAGFHNSKKINQIILEVKIQDNQIDKNSIEKVINFREIRFSKYCTGINCLLKSI